MSQLVSVSEYLRLPRSAETWLLKDLLPVGGSMLVHGEAKVGKSFLILQLCQALQAGGAWMGFEVRQTSRIAYIQIDTPRSLWADRMEKVIATGFRLDDQLLMADRETLNTWPFDIMNPSHASLLRHLVSTHHADVVIIDTIRAAHSGKENDSDVMQNVMNQLVAATQPAALILIAHSKKPNFQAGGPDVIHDNRGSSAVVGAVDAIMGVRKKSITYVGRAIEEGVIKATREDNGLWRADETDFVDMATAINADPAYPSIRAKAKALAQRSGKTEEACRSILRRLS